MWSPKIEANVSCADPKKGRNKIKTKKVKILMVDMAQFKRNNLI
jgi:hypothetical protein